MDSDKNDKLPALNVTVGVPADPTKQEIVKAEQLTNYYNEIFDDIRQDREEVSDVLKNFMEMVINEGDSTSASKEALVNLIKIKSDIADKKTRVMDLLIRAFMKDRSIPGYIAAHQTNNYIESGSKRNLLKALEQAEKNEQK